MIHVRLFCGGGMSTSLLARKMKTYAESKGIEAEVDARAVATITASSIEQLKELDCAMLGPQVAFEAHQFMPKFEEAGVPCAVIDMRDYGLVNGEKVMQTALDMIERAKANK